MMKAGGEEGGKQPPPFLSSLYALVNDAKTASICSWNQQHRDLGTSAFTVWDSADLEKKVIPKYFKHKNFTSFIRQLNHYSFRKVDSEMWTFAHPRFLEGKPQLLSTIRRKRKPRVSTGEPAQTAQFGADHAGDLDIGQTLAQENGMLMMELAEMRRRQNNMLSEMQTVTDIVRRGQKRQNENDKLLDSLVDAITTNNDSNRGSGDTSSSGQRLAIVLREIVAKRQASASMEVKHRRSVLDDVCVGGGAEVAAHDMRAGRPRMDGGVSALQDAAVHCASQLLTSRAVQAHPARQGGGAGAASVSGGGMHTGHGTLMQGVHARVGGRPGPPTMMAQVQQAACSQAGGGHINVSVASSPSYMKMEMAPMHGSMDQQHYLAAASSAEVKYQRSPGYAVHVTEAQPPPLPAQVFRGEAQQVDILQHFI